MKIFFIIDSLQRYGAQRFLIHLTRGLRDLGYAQTVIALNDASGPNIEQDLFSAGCAVIRIGKRALLLGGAGWWRLVAVLKRSRPDVVMTLLDFADTLGRPAVRLAGCRVLVSSIRARNLAKPAWQRWFDRRTVAWADKVVFNSAHVVRYGCQKEGVRQEQVVVIPNGVQDLLARSGTCRSSYREQLGVRPDTILLGSVGRLYPQKNFPLLLRAAARLTTAKQWKILLIGDGPERPQLLSLAQKLGIKDRLEWLGARDDVEAWLAAMDMFIHTADFEGMPNAVMEAMAMGLPIVASDVDGTRDLIQDSVNGYLVPPGDAVAFAKQIDGVIDSPDLAKRLGGQAHRDVLERFGVSRMVHAYHRLFLSLVNPTIA